MFSVRSQSRARLRLSGLVVLTVFCAAVVVAVQSSAGLSIGHFTTVRAAFADVGPLLVGDEVRINSARAGRVDEIRYDGQHAVVTMTLEDGRPVYRDASASIGARNGLGQKFVELEPGKPRAGVLGDGVIDVVRTRSTTELDTVLDVFDPATRASTADTLRELGGTAGHGSDLHRFLQTAPGNLDNLGRVGGAAGEPSTDLAGLLRQSDRLASRFTGRDRQVGDLVDQLGDSVSALASDHGAKLGESLSQSPKTLSDTNRALDALHQPLADTQAALATLRPGARALGEATPDVRGVLTESPAPLSKVPAVAELATPAVSELTDTAAVARPLAPELAGALNRLRAPLGTLSGYAPEMAMLFTNAASALSQGGNSGNWLRLLLTATTESATGAAPVADPLTHRNPYPAPGVARSQREPTIGGGGK